MTNVLALFAHPDDAEFLCAGTLAHLAARGATIHIATMTSGDCGSATLPPRRISAVRRHEAAQSAGLIGARYLSLGQKDLSIFYDRHTLRKVMAMFRRVRPDLVFTHSPSDYMVDHEITSRLAQSVSFGAMAPNYRTPALKALDRIPHLYYTQPVADHDILGNEIRPRILVDITATFARKEQMLACHQSQQEWLRAQQGLADYTSQIRRMAGRAGELARVQWAEGFRQHLGQGFPGNNLLAELLGDLVRASV